MAIGDYSKGIYDHLYRRFFENRDCHKGYDFQHAPGGSAPTPAVTFAEKLRWWSFDRWRRRKQLLSERDRLQREILQIKNRPPRSNGPFVLAILVLLAGGALLNGHLWAIQTESQAEKEANFKQQALGGLFQRWTFDQPKTDEAVGDFSQLVVGGESATVWTIGADAGAPSPPHILKAGPSCQTTLCYHLFIANKLHYEYPDVTVRLRFPAEGDVGRGGIVIGVQDERHFYGALVDLAAKKLEVVRVIDEQVTVLGETVITPKPVDWHSLRMNRDTIISKDVIEVFFDGRLMLSVQDQTLGLGQVGLVTWGPSPLHFDSLHAVPLFSQRPVSNPAAY